MNYLSDSRYVEYYKILHKEKKSKHNDGLKEILNNALKNPAYTQGYLNLKYEDNFGNVKGDIDALLVHENGNVVAFQHKCNLNGKNYRHAVDQSHRSLDYIRREFRPKILTQIISGDEPIRYIKLDRR